MSSHPSKACYKTLEFDGFICFQHVSLIMTTDFDIVMFAKTLSTELSKVTDKGINITFNINVYTDSSEKKCSCHSNKKSVAIPRNSKFASRRARPYETRKLNSGDLSTRVPLYEPSPSIETPNYVQSTVAVSDTPLTGYGMNHGTVTPNPDSSNKTVESYDKSISGLADKSNESTIENEHKRILELYNDYNKTYNRNLQPNESAVPSHTENNDTNKPVEDAKAPADNKSDTNTTSQWRILYRGKPIVDDTISWRTYSTNHGYL